LSLQRFATAFAWCMVPSLLQAQLPPLGIPKGMLRVEVQAQFGSASTRFADGTREDLGADFTAAALGPAELPVLAEPSRRLGVLIGSSSYQLNLGASEGFANQTRSFGALGLGIGLSNRITLFARAPFVYATSSRTANVAAATGDAGINPADPSLGTVQDPPAVIPLSVDDRVVGTIAIFSTLAQKNKFDQVDFELFKLLGQHAAQALVAASLFAQAEQKLPGLEAFLDLSV